MKRIVSILAVTMLLFAAMPVMAQEPECAIDPDWTQTKINDTLEACKKNVTPDQVARDVSTYAEVAKGVAEALGVAAREIGIATNDFVKTDAGKITVALIVWQVAGDDIKGILFGFPLIVFGIWFFFATTRYATRTGEFTTRIGWFGHEKQVPKHRPMGDLDGEVGYIAVGVIVLAFCLAFGIGGILF